MNGHKITSGSAPDNQYAASAAPLLLDIPTTAQQLSMSQVSVRKLVRAGRLKRIAAFRKILIPATELARFASATE